MKRDYNEFRRITRSKTSAARLSAPPPLKWLKTESITLFQGFELLPNEVVEMIVEWVPRHLDGVTRIVCKRWKDAIDRRWQLAGPYRNPVYWAIKNHKMALLKWVIRGVDPHKRHKMFMEQEEWEYCCSEYVNLEAMKWLSNQAHKESLVFLTETGVEGACRYGDLAFLKEILALHGACEKWSPEWYATVDMKCLIVSCAGSGGLLKVKWIRQKLQPDLELSTYLLRMCWREASEHGQLDVFKWVYNLIPFGCSLGEYGKIALGAVMHGSKPEILEWFSIQPGVASMAICHASFPQRAINHGKAEALEWWWQKNNKDASKAFVLGPFNAQGAILSTPVKYDVLNWLAEHDQLKVTPNLFLWPPQVRYEFVPVLEWLWSHTDDKAGMLREFRKTGPNRLFSLLARAIRHQSLKMCGWLENHGFIQAGVLIEGDILRLRDIVNYERRSETAGGGEEVYDWWETSGNACLLPAKQCQPQYLG